VAVRIRMKKQGRKHRPFFRICAVDGRNPRNGRVIEELGTYDPMIGDVDARTTLKNERVTYWLSVGAQPSEKVAVLIKKYGPEGTHTDANAAAREKLAMPKAKPELKEAADVKVMEEKKAADEKAKAEAEAAAAKAAEEEAKATAAGEAKAAESEAAEAAAAEAPAEQEEAANAEENIQTPAEENVADEEAAKQDTPAEEAAEEAKKEE